MWKAIYQGEGQGEGGLGRTQHRGGWWEASDRALKTEGCHEGKPTLGVTPAILSVDIALGMQQEIEELYKGDFEDAQGKPAKWDEILFHLLTKKGRHDWTEYTLYWAYGCKAGKNENYHTLSPNLPGSTRNLRLYGYWGWNWGAQLKPAEFKNRNTVFGVLQSISGANGNHVAAQLFEYILPDEDGGESEWAAKASLADKY